MMTIRAIRISELLCGEMSMRHVSNSHATEHRREEDEIQLESAAPSRA
jgi:hypothetical protein